MKALALPLSRPVGTGAWYLALLLIGVASLVGLPLSLTPDVDYPSLTVGIGWSNASPRVMEAMVTSRVEQEVERVRGVRGVYSISGRGEAIVQLEFERDTDMDRAEVFLRERLAALQEFLPPGVSAPRIVRTTPDEMDQGDFVVLRAAGPHTAETLRRALEDRVVPRLLAIPGVAGAEVYGGNRREIRVDVGREEMERGMVSSETAMSALRSVGQDESLGSLVAGSHRVPIVLERDEPESGAIGSRQIGGSPDRPIALSEVADVAEGWEEPTRISRVNGEPSVQVFLEREPGTNVIRVAGTVLGMLDELEALLPEGMALEAVHDQSEQIRSELGNLAERAAISLAAIFFVLVLAQGRLRAPVVVMSTVFFSALGTFLLFRATGLGMNLITLSGLALAFGMAVDNSIVILENVHHRRTRARASLAGKDLLITLAAAREVMFPLLAATLTTAVVLTPFLYLSGDLRAYYFPFVLSVCLSLAASLVVALTLTPLLSRWSFRGEVDTRFAGARARWGALFSDRALDGYDSMLRPLVARPWIPILTALLLFAGSIWAFQTQVETGNIFGGGGDSGLRVGIGFPTGTDIFRTDAMIREFEDLVLEHDFYDAGYIKQVSAMTFGNRGSLNVRLHPAVVETVIPQTLKEDLTLRAASVSGASVAVSGYGPGFNSGGASVSPSYQLNLKGPNFLELAELAEDLGARLGRHPRIRDINTNASSWLVADETQLTIIPDRLAFSRLGLTMRDVVGTLQTGVASDLSTEQLRTDDGEVNGRVRLGNGEALTPEELRASAGFAGLGIPVSLGELIRLEEEPVQSEVRRRDQQYERTVTFDFRGPRRVGNRFVESLVENTELPDGYTMTDGFSVFLTSDEEREILGALLLAFLLIYMVAAALFESLLFPFVALLSVPFSFIGIAAIFWATGESFDRTAYIGLILLAGIAINNALLLVHRAGALFRRSGDPVGSALRAARERMRPILMTTVTSVAGLLPLAIGGDPGSSGSWRSLSLSAMAGISMSAIVTLFLIPVFFSVLARLSRRFRPSRPRTSIFSDVPSFGPLTQPGEISG